MTDRHTPNDRRPTIADVEEILVSLGESDVDLEPAPAGSWEAIADRLDLSVDPAGPDLAPERLAPVVEIPSLRSFDSELRPASDPSVDDGETEGSTDTVPAPPEPVASTRRSRPRHWSRIGLAAAAAAIAVIGGLALVDDRAEAPVSAATATLVHEAAFDPVGEASTAAVNVVERDDDLVVEFTAADLPDGDLADGEGLELWLLSDDPDGAVVGLVSLGEIDPSSPGTFSIPADVDLDEFSLVDISVEPDDGDPDHSGRSILRGRLSA